MRPTLHPTYPLQFKAHGSSGNRYTLPTSPMNPDVNLPESLLAEEYRKAYDLLQKYHVTGTPINYQQPGQLAEQINGEKGQLLAAHLFTAVVLLNRYQKHPEQIAKYLGKAYAQVKEHNPAKASPRQYQDFENSHVYLPPNNDAMTVAEFYQNWETQEKQATNTLSQQAKQHGGEIF